MGKNPRLGGEGAVRKGWEPKTKGVCGKVKKMFAVWGGLPETRESFLGGQGRKNFPHVEKPEPLT